ELAPAKERLIVPLEPSQDGARARVHFSKHALCREVIEIRLMGEDDLALVRDEHVHGDEGIDLRRPARYDGLRRRNRAPLVQIFDERLESLLVGSWLQLSELLSSL